MKVWVEDKESDSSACTICVKVGNKTYRSWWSSPPKSINHVHLGYLKDIYSIITTEKRAIEFKRLYKLLWVEVSDKQRSEMSNSLGLLRSKKPYRNRFYTDRNDENWNDLVNKGLAIKGGGWDDNNCYFHLTKDGVEFILGRNISQTTYDEL